MVFIAFQSHQSSPLIISSTFLLNFNEVALCSVNPGLFVLFAMAIQSPTAKIKSKAVRGKEKSIVLENSALQLEDAGGSVIELFSSLFVLGRILLLGLLFPRFKIGAFAVSCMLGWSWAEVTSECFHLGPFPGGRRQRALHTRSRSLFGRFCGIKKHVSPRTLFQCFCWRTKQVKLENPVFDVLVEG